MIIYRVPTYITCFIKCSLTSLSTPSYLDLGDTRVALSSGSGQRSSDLKGRWLSNIFINVRPYIDHFQPSFRRKPLHRGPATLTLLMSICAKSIRDSEPQRSLWLPSVRTRVVQCGKPFSGAGRLLYSISHRYSTLIE
jgi:hypothetical protein